MGVLEWLLRKVFPHKEIGWEDIGERFTRFTLLKTPWFNVYLHKLYAPAWHPQCHDHPWSFVAVILAGGYLERTDKGDVWRAPGSVLYRPAEFTHNVVTRGVSWSVILTTARKRAWGFKDCGGDAR
jgi:hypothetical protein